MRWLAMIFGVIPPDEWDFCFLFFAKVAISGERITGHAMRRRVKGVWEYRPMTHAEAMDKLELSQW